MKSILLYTAFLLYSSTLIASEHPIPNPEVNSGPPTTRAVIIGISDYQDPDIPDLRFAHKDAEAFAGWLQSAGGGNLPGEQIMLLLNEEATGARFTAAIDWLLTESKENDKVIIYFSGHGDMEAKIMNQLGFLLLWDSPANSYLAGALPVDILKNVITTLSVEKKSKVLMVADACRAGKLAGNRIIGSQLTNANLGVQFANELKILSCQENEYSIEGEQWGGGRGAFSFHLVNGLYGLADNNRDQRINLSEIERFVQDQVAAEVAPLTQIPLAVGDKNEWVSSEIDLIQVKKLKKGKQVKLSRFAKVDQRGLVEDVLKGKDPVIVQVYTDFVKAIEEKRFLEPVDDCADQYYQKLVQTEEIRLMHNFLLRNYTAALQDDAQQSINAILKSDPGELNRSRKNIYDQYRRYPAQLARSAELLGKDHYMYNLLKAREHLFEGIVQYFQFKDEKEDQQEHGELVFSHYTKSLDKAPQLPATHFFISICAANLLQDAELAIKHAELAIQYADAWILPYTHLAYYLVRKSRKFPEAKQYLDRAMAIDSANVIVWKSMVSWHFYQRQLPEATIAAEKALSLDSTDVYTWLNLGNLKQNQYKFDEAETALLKCIELDSIHYLAHYYLGKNYARWKKNDLTEKYYLKAVELDPAASLARSSLAAFYFGQEKYMQSEGQYLQLIKYQDPKADTWLTLAWLTAVNGDPEQALDYLDKALQKGYKNRQVLEEDEGFQSMRELSRYRNLMKVYFKD